MACLVNLRGEHLENLKVETAFLLVMAAICLCISTYQTANGYLDAAGGFWLSLPIAVLISGAMGLISFRLWRTKRSAPERPTLLALFVFVSFFSVAANFNAFYSNKVAEEVAARDVAETRILMDSLEAEIDSASAQVNTSSEELILSLEREKAILLAQVRDPNEPGVGSRARLVIRRINKLIGTSLSIPNRGDPELQASMLEGQIDRIIEEEKRRVENRNLGLRDSAKKRFENARLSLATSEQSPGSGELRVQTALALEDYNKIGADAKGLLAQAGIDFTPKRLDSSDIGSIPFAFRSALSGEFPVATIIALLMALLIDYTIPVLILVVQGGEKLPSAHFPDRRNARGEPFV